MWQFIIPAAASVLGSVLGSRSQAGVNEANAEIAGAQMQFNAEQAHVARQFAQDSAHSAMMFEQEQANANRIFNQEQANAGRIFSQQEAQTARQFSEREADKNRAFQEYMSNTSYRRAVGDMQAAGLNPMLAYSQGGAPMASGAMGQSFMASAPNAAGSGFASGRAASAAQASYNSLPARQSVAMAGLQSAAMAAQIGNIAADTELKKAQANQSTSSAANLDAQTKRTLYELQEVVPEQIRMLRAQQGTELWRQAVLDTQSAVNRVSEKLQHSNIGLVEARRLQADVHTLLLKLALPEARNNANAQDSWWMEHIVPYLRSIGMMLGTAGGVTRSITGD